MIGLVIRCGVLVLRPILAVDHETFRNTVQLVDLRQAFSVFVQLVFFF